MSVYFIQAGDHGPIKIGTTKDGNEEARLQTLQTGCAEDLSLVAVEPGGVDEERRLHERFAEYRLRGEWFRPGVKLAAYLDRMDLLPPEAFEAYAYARSLSAQADRDLARSYGKAWKEAITPMSEFPGCVHAIFLNHPRPPSWLARLADEDYRRRHPIDESLTLKEQMDRALGCPPTAAEVQRARLARQYGPALEAAAVAAGHPAA